MRQRLAVVLLVLASPAAVRADKTVPPLLPPGSQVYISWDGFTRHRQDYDKTAIAKMMKGDMGKFLHALGAQIGEQARTVLAGQLDAELVQALNDNCAAFLETTGKHGLLLGIEVRKLNPVQVEAVAVFPKGAGGEKSVLALMPTVLKLAGKESQEVRVIGRKVRHVDLGEVHVTWWAEGEDAVVALGTDGPESLLRRLTARGKKGLADRPLYKQVHGFQEFKSWGRGYVDFAGLGKVVGGASPELAKLLDDLGLRGLKSLTFQSGFEGPAEIGLVELDVPGPRKGVLSLLGKTKFTLADLPPLPDDVEGFSAASLEVSQLYPVVVQTVEAVVRLVAPDFLPQLQNAIGQADEALGVKLGPELFGSLGDLVVQYSAWAEGPLGLGQVTLVKVKNAQKLEKALEKLVDGLGKLQNQFAPGLPGNLSLKKQTYRGVVLHQVQLGGPITITLPTYTIHKGWLAYSAYPQPLQGFILRSKGELPAWKVGGQVGKALEAFPKEMVGISVSDPRPTLKVVLSVLPVVLTLANGLMQQFGLGQGGEFDVGLVPNAYEATRYLFPNVTVTTEEGGRLRSLTRSSLPLPF